VLSGSMSKYHGTTACAGCCTMAHVPWIGPARTAAIPAGSPAAAPRGVHRIHQFVVCALSVCFSLLTLGCSTDCTSKTIKVVVREYYSARHTHKVTTQRIMLKRLRLIHQRVVQSRLSTDIIKPLGQAYTGSTTINLDCSAAPARYLRHD
jgi:hypothetical protein